jgi:hypothetical protein
MVTRAVFLKMSIAAAAAFAGAPSSNLRGKLIQRDGQAPVIETADHKMISLKGDDPTQAILKDKRLAGLDFEIKGRFLAPDQFEVATIENRALIVHKDDKLFRVTYYCDVCSIRTYSPGPCPCCQAETRLDLIDPSQDR